MGQLGAELHTIFDSVTPVRGKLRTNTGVRDQKFESGLPRDVRARHIHEGCGQITERPEQRINLGS